MPLLRPLRRPGSDRRRRLKLESDPAQPRDRASIGAFDPASLPSIETIAAETDIRAFLDERVPSELTRLALRRAWASDPAIRDFIGIAENQWDFNDPNAIPGFGPLRASDNLLSLLVQQALGNADRLAETMAAFPASRAQAQSSVLDREATNLDRSAGRTLDVASETRPNPGRLAVGSDAKGGWVDAPAQASRRAAVALLIHMVVRRTGVRMAVPCRGSRFDLRQRPAEPQAETRTKRMQEPTSPLLPESAVDEIDCTRAREYALLGTLPSHSPDARLIGQLALLMGDATLGRAHALLGKAPAARASKALRGSISICLSGSDSAGCCRMRPIIWPTRCTAVRSPASVTPFGGLCVD
ncbi:hypothetical protein CQ12_00265 [Bradyrhizobium jicamae]|uniref:Uncharacterized protein n=1 Tax=Bradyrhizobium jicamae TaxID=280332 RepID=A0A0R3LPM3_9BRAD|nr:DUF3306 domain-containing protein [Bradyrhizobium jicamae]KRR07267.1 hypothetical protein CQ12_00265 [Bradyrhizobium jicamae]